MVSSTGRHIWLVSDARSGSTWFSSMLNHRSTFAEYFEPLHSHFSSELANEPLIPYARPGKLPDLYRNFYSGIFQKSLVLPHSGPSGHDRKLVLIKDIHAMLIARAVSYEFPLVDVVCLVRDPIDVASSKLGLSEWIWFREPKELLQNPYLREDWLARYEKIIQAAETQFQKYVVLWASMYYVFSQQFSSDDVTYVKYGEDLATLKGTVDIILERAAGVKGDAREFELAFKTPSRTQVAMQRYKPSHGELEYAVSIVSTFGLNNLLDPSWPHCGSRGR
jgi:Sulfotransferase domain